MRSTLMIWHHNARHLGSGELLYNFHVLHADHHHSTICKSQVGPAAGCGPKGEGIRPAQNAAFHGQHPKMTSSMQVSNKSNQLNVQHT